MQDLRAIAIRGGVATFSAQAVNFSLRIVALMVLARVLDPKDFGFIGMVTAITGALNLFRDFGLSAAAVQHASLTNEQSSTLFWINVAVGATLSLVLVAMAPFVVAFYREPSLFWVTIALASVFLISAAGIQHSALLQRRMRFTSLATIDVASQASSVVVGLVMAMSGFGYWSLVGMSITVPTVGTLGLWLVSQWRPGQPQMRAGVHSMMRFGGTVTLNGLLVYVAYNLEKALLGRFWGPEAVGIYGRSFQLINIPTESLNSAAGAVVFPVLSRVRDDPGRFKNYFLKAYALVMALTIPIAIGCALFADDLLLVLLGPKWSEAAPVFRLLAPTILIFAMINPMVWLLYSLGLVERSLKIALAIAPVVIAGYVVGLPYGPKGVAFGYSAMLALWLIPHIVWCVRGTPIAVGDVLLTVTRPIVSGLLAAAAAFGVQSYFGQSGEPALRLLLGGSVFLSAYLAMLLYVMGQKILYVDLVRGWSKRPPIEEKVILTSDTRTTPL
jgi:O-antigen/teichoic acid export membrane protein